MTEFSWSPDELKSVFPIQTTASTGDKLSLAYLQRAVESLLPEYTYLEIGSWKGGTLFLHLIQGACKEVFSLDNRPKVTKDSGEATTYVDNSTENMVKVLSLYAPDNIMSKLTCLEGDSWSPLSEFTTPDGRVGKEKPIRANLFLIDGEYSNERTLADFELCLQLSDYSAAYIIRRADLVPGVMRTCLKKAMTLSNDVYALPLPDNMFVITKNLDLFSCVPLVVYAQEYGHLAYLSALELSAPLREFYNHPFFTFLRNLRNKILFRKRLPFWGLKERMAFWKAGKKAI